MGGAHRAACKLSVPWALGHERRVLTTALPGDPRLLLFFTSLNYLSNFLHNDKQFQVIVGKIWDAEKIPGIATTLSPPTRETRGLWTLRPGSQALTGAESWRSLPAGPAQ